ncbi:MAG: cold shock domain-containing protein [Acidimicrobiales bacterium]
MSPARGVVASFDADTGLGTVTQDDGDSYGFHCTQIADGSRKIEVGTVVTFRVGPGGPGVWEAKSLRPEG